MKGVPPVSETHLKRFLLYAAAATAAAALLYVTLGYLLLWLLPFLIALAAAAMMEPAVRFLCRRLRLKRSFASLVLTLFALFLLGGLLSLLGTTLTGEVYALLEHAPALLGSVPIALKVFSDRLSRYSVDFPPWFRVQIDAALARFSAEAGDLTGALAQRLPSVLATLAGALPRFFLASATSVLAIYFTSSSMPYFRSLFSLPFFDGSRRFLLRFRAGITSSLTRWLRAELTLSLVTFSILLVFFVFLRQPYALLLAFLITLVDALPVFGTGTVLLPWAVVEIMMQNIPKSIALLLLYLLAFTIRSVLEPRLLGKQAGLPPIVSLLAMYLGFCSMGVAGMVFLPFLLLLAAQLTRKEKGESGA